MPAMYTQLIKRDIQACEGKVMFRVTTSRFHFSFYAFFYNLFFMEVNFSIISSSTLLVRCVLLQTEVKEKDYINFPFQYLFGDMLRVSNLVGFLLSICLLKN